MCDFKFLTSFSLNTQLLSRVNVRASYTFLSFPPSAVIALSIPVPRSRTLLTVMGREMCSWHLTWNSQWMSYSLRTLWMDWLYGLGSESWSTINNVMGVPSNQLTNFGTAKCTKCSEGQALCLSVQNCNAVILYFLVWAAQLWLRVCFPLESAIQSILGRVRKKPISVLVKQIAKKESCSSQYFQWYECSGKVSFQCFFMTQDTHQGREWVSLQATLQVVGGWKFQEPETFCYLFPLCSATR